MSFSVVDRVVGNTERYKAIANRVPLCHEFVTEGPTLLLMTPVHLYAFDATTFDELCFEDATRVREQKTPHSTFVVPVRERTNRNSFLPPCVKKSSVAGRGFIGTPQLLLRPMVNASNRALPFISHLSLSSAWIHHAAGSHVVVIKFADPVDSESEQVKNSISRVRIAPKQSPEGAELHIPILEPATLEPWPEEAARFVNCLNEFLHQFSARRPARPMVELIPETTAEWAEELKTSVERSGRESRMAKSIAKTDRSRARTANGVDTWGSRKNAQLLRDVLSGDWSSLLDIKFDGDNAPADSRWDPLFDALRTRVVPQNYIDDSQYRPVLLHFNSVEDLSADLLSRFFDAVESNYMRVISVNIEGFCPKFGNDGLKRLLSLVERDNNCVSSFNIAPTVMEADALLDPILRGKSQQVLDNIARQVTRAAMAKRRVSPLL